MNRIITLFLFCPALLFGQYPMLDFNFASSGHLFQYSNNEFSSASALGIQSDGKIIVGGYEGVVSSFMKGKLFRLSSNGEIDSSFGLNGFVQDTTLPEVWAIWRLAIQNDDKVVCIGWSDYLETGLIARFTSNGILDTTFYGSGFRIIDLNPSLNFWHSLIDIEILPNNKILVLGAVEINAVGREIFLMQFMPDGQLDLGFGINGLAMNFTAANRELDARDFFVGDDRSIYVGGSTKGGITSNPTIVKVDSTGNTDLSFGTNGLLRFPTLAAEYTTSFFKIDSDAMLLVVGEKWNSAYNNLVYAKAFTNGYIDSTYGTNGLNFVRLTDRGNYLVGQAILLADGSTIQCLGNQDGAFNRFALTRILPTGKIDSTFGNNGILLSNLPATSSYLNIHVLDATSFITSGSWWDSNSSALLVSKYAVNSYLHNAEFRLKDFDIYPNPSTGYIQIRSVVPGVYKCFNQNGQQVWKGIIKAKSNTNIDLSLLPNGVYYLKSDSGVAEKIVIQR